MSDMDHFASSELMRAMDSMMPVAKSDGRTRGKVTKVEPDGTVWVALKDSQGVVEMPCRRSVVAAKPGDTVAVTVRERRAIVESNISSPAVTVEQAEGLVKTSAQELADNTNQLFQSAISDAQAAHEAAGRAEKDAQSAADSAASAATSAASAATSAENAERDAERSAVAAELSERKALESNGYALGALNSLATLQDVMGTIGWAADNAAFVEASGEYDPNGRYFVKGGYWLPKTLTQEQYEDGTWYVKGDDGTYSEATGDYDADAAYYTWVTGTFTDTQDPPNLYAVVPESSKADFDAGSYYVMDMRQSMAEYVSKHVVFAYGTLWITPDGVTGEGIAGEGDDPAGRIAIGTEGITLYDGHGRRIARYGSGVDLGAAGDGTQTSIASDVLALLREAVIDGEPGTYPVFQVGTEAGENPFLQFADGKGHDLFTVDSTGKPAFAKPVPIPSGGTDATNRGDAADNLLVQSIGSGMELPSAFDFNTLTAPGNFTFGWSENVKNLTNRPSKLTSAFRLTVWKFFGNENDRTNEAIRVQVVHEYNTSRVFQRYSTNAGASWSAWVCQVRDNDVIDSAHGGLGSTSINGATGAVRTLFDTNLPDAAYITVFDDANDGGYMNMSQLLSKVGAAPRVHTHSSIYTIGDKREVATKPSDYTNQITFCGLKRNSVIGSPSSDAYSYVIGIRGWSDNSGGYTREIALNNTGMYIRKASGDTTWYAWYRVFDLSMTLGSANIANGAVTADKLASSSVTNAKLANGAVSAGKLDSSTQDLVKMEDRVATVATNMISGNNHLYLTKRGSVRVLTIDGSYGFNGDTASWSSYQIGSISSVVDRPVRSTSAPLYSDDGVMIVRVTGTGQIFIDTRNIAIRKGVSFFGQVVW